MRSNESIAMGWSTQKFESEKPVGGGGGGMWAKRDCSVVCCGYNNYEIPLLAFCAEPGSVYSDKQLNWTPSCS